MSEYYIIKEEGGNYYFFDEKPLWSKEFQTWSAPSVSWMCAELFEKLHPFATKILKNEKTTQDSIIEVIIEDGSLKVNSSGACLVKKIISENSC